MPYSTTRSVAFKKKYNRALLTVLMRDCHKDDQHEMLDKLYNALACLWDYIPETKTKTKKG